MEKSSGLEAGAIVRLKSGGPDMTVKAVLASNGNIRCQWFAGKKLEAGDFPEKSLETVESKPQEA